MGGAVFPAYILASGRHDGSPSKGLMSGLLYLVPLTPGPATVEPRLCWRLLDIHSLAQSLVMPLLHFPEFWWTQGFFCALQESVYPVVWKFCNHIPLSFKVKFPGGPQSLCGIPRLGNLLWALELVQQCENFLVQSLSSLWVVCSVTMWWGLHATAPSLAAASIPAPVACHCGPVPLQETLSCSEAGLAQSLAESLVSGAHMVFFEPSEHLWQV